MNDKPNVFRNRRSFLRTGLTAAGATVGAGLLARGTKALAQTPGGSAITAGDVAMLQFLAAGEAIEADFYEQYNELGGIQDSEVSGGSGNPIYREMLKKIYRNFPQYIHDIADDEMSHRDFLNAYLVANGTAAVDMEQFRALPGSTATGSSGQLRLTNLMQLTLDTSWWTRYRSSTNNPDINPTTFEQAVPGLQNGQFTAIPRVTPTCTPMNTFRPLPTRRHFTSRPWNKAAAVCAWRWRRGLQAWRCYDSSSAWDRLR
jgi:Ferritin-like domain